MTAITIETARTGSGWILGVTISDGTGSTNHRVTLSKEEYDKIRGDSEVSPEELVKKSFEFLLKREPKESILGEFELSLIGQYFPEYFDEIKKQV